MPESKWSPCRRFCCKRGLFYSWVCGFCCWSRTYWRCLRLPSLFPRNGPHVCCVAAGCLPVMDWKRRYHHVWYRSIRHSRKRHNWSCWQFPPNCRAPMLKNRMLWWWAASVRFRAECWLRRHTGLERIRKHWTGPCCLGRSGSKQGWSGTLWTWCPYCCWHVRCNVRS